MSEIHPIFLAQQRHFAYDDIKKNKRTPFVDHPQIPLMMDSLARYAKHHLLIKTHLSFDLQQAFLKGFEQALKQDHSPQKLRHATMTLFSHDDLCHDDSDKQENLGLTLIACQYPEILCNDTHHHCAKKLEQLLNNPSYRLLLFTTTTHSSYPTFVENHCSILSLESPDELDQILLIENKKSELEQFHHVNISNELILFAYSLAKRYLNPIMPLEQTLLLLDSACARTTKTSTEISSLLTADAILQVLSQLTMIPITHLLPSHFDLTAFITGLQKNIFGQDMAASLIAREMQHAQLQLQQKQGPLCSLLFVGPDHTGKKSAAIALAKQLFTQLNLFYIASFQSNHSSTLSDIVLHRFSDQRIFSIKEVTEKTPHAIIFFESIDEAPATILAGINQILTTGYLSDKNKIQYPFQEMILIFSTTLAADHLIQIAASLEAPQEKQLQSGLMQILMGDPLSTHKTRLDFNEQSLAVLSETLQHHLSKTLCEASRIIPFLPLKQDSIEKMMRAELNLLAKWIETRYGIGFGYAEEVITYLGASSLTREKTMKQLYGKIEQSLLNANGRNRSSHQLLLKLNETGETLRCDWLETGATRQHTL